MASLTVITLTLNEERNIADCLASVRWADEIIVIDSGSTDRTLEIARQYTDRIETVEWKGYGAARNLGISRASGDWILWLDATSWIIGSASFCRSIWNSKSTVTELPSLVANMVISTCPPRLI